MKNNKKPETVDTVHTHTHKSFLLKNVSNGLGKPKIINNIKNNYKFLLIIVLLVINILFNLIVGLFFNQKLNKMDANTKKWIDKINVSKVENKTNYEFTNLIETTENYNPTMEYFNYPDDKQKNSFKNVIRDENGVRLVNVRGEVVYNPVSISQYGLFNISQYIETGDKECLNISLTQADYLVQTQDKKNGKFYYNFDYKLGGTNSTLKAPWASAMAQGQAISLFCRVYNETKDEKYLKAAKLALMPLTIEVEKGGLVADFFGHPYLEEYPTEPSSYTLNGYMFTIIGVYDLYYISKDKTAKNIFDTSMETLKYCLPFYDYNGITLYHLGHINDNTLKEFYIERYHAIHISQLQILNQIDQDEIFEYYIKKWTAYMKS